MGGRTSSKPRALTALLLALLLASTGCSRIITKGPPAHAQGPQPCTTSGVGPGVDTAIAVVYGAAGIIGTVIFLSQIPTIGHEEPSDTAPPWLLGAVSAVSGAVIAIPFGLSARTGNARVRACRAHRKQWQPTGDPYPAGG